MLAAWTPSPAGLEREKRSAAGGEAQTVWGTIKSHVRKGVRQELTKAIEAILRLEQNLPLTREQSERLIRELVDEWLEPGSTG